MWLADGAGGTGCLSVWQEVSQTLRGTEEGTVSVYLCTAQRDSGGWCAKATGVVVGGGEGPRTKAFTTSRAEEVKQCALNDTKH